MMNVCITFYRDKLYLISDLEKKRGSIGFNLKMFLITMEKNFADPVFHAYFL